MQAEMKMPGQKSRYTGVFNAYYTIGKFEGMAGLYKGKITWFFVTHQQCSGYM